MLISECKVGMEVKWKRDGYADWIGRIIEVHRTEVNISCPCDIPRTNGLCRYH